MGNAWHIPSRYLLLLMIQGFYLFTAAVRKIRDREIQFNGMDSVIFFKIRQDGQDCWIFFVFINFRACRAIVLNNQDDGGKKLMKSNPPLVKKLVGKSASCLKLYLYLIVVLKNCGNFLIIMAYLAEGDWVFFVSSGNKE